MSAWPEEPGDFLRWLRRHVAVDFPEGGYAPRLHYAQYLAGVLERAADSPGVRLSHLPVRATDLRRHGNRLRLTLADGTSRPVDAAVLAPGYDRPSTAWAPAGPARSDRFVADPWSTEPYVGRGEEVVVVGARADRGRHGPAVGPGGGPAAPGVPARDAAAAARGRPAAAADPSPTPRCRPRWPRPGGCCSTGSGPPAGTGAGPWTGSGR